jgi:hypothetical protein
MLTLQDILRIRGIPDDARIKLFRHTPKEGSPEEAWKLKWLHEYERMHGADFKVPEFTVTFIPVPGDARSVRFLWVKRVDAKVDRSSLPKDPMYPFQRHYSSPGVALDLTRLTAFDDLEGRMIVEWNLPTRSYDYWLDHNRPMRVLELHAVGSCDRFPGYTKVFLTFEELRTIVEHPAQNRDWHAALAAVKGIYLVTNTSDGTAYIGKASGAHGFLGRWSNYAETGGHGGNVELRQKVLNDPAYVKSLRWSLLHVLPGDSLDFEIDELESLAKQKLGTRIVGLNKN